MKKKHVAMDMISLEPISVYPIAIEIVDPTVFVLDQVFVDALTATNCLKTDACPSV